MAGVQRIWRCGPEWVQILFASVVRDALQKLSGFLDGTSCFWMLEHGRVILRHDPVRLVGGKIIHQRHHNAAIAASSCWPALEYSNYGHFIPFSLVLVGETMAFERVGYASVGFLSTLTPLYSFPRSR